MERTKTSSQIAWCDWSPAEYVTLLTGLIKRIWPAETPLTCFPILSNFPASALHPRSRAEEQMWATTFNPWSSYSCYWLHGYDVFHQSDTVLGVCPSTLEMYKKNGECEFTLNKTSNKMEAPAVLSVSSRRVHAVTCGFISLRERLSLIAVWSETSVLEDQLSQLSESRRDSVSLMQIQSSSYCWEPSQLTRPTGIRWGWDRFASNLPALEINLADIILPGKCQIYICASKDWDT